MSTTTVIPSTNDWREYWARRGTSWHCSIIDRLRRADDADARMGSSS
jgi:hypothetical protein